MTDRYCYSSSLSLLSLLSPLSLLSFDISCTSTLFSIFIVHCLLFSCWYFNCFKYFSSFSYSIIFCFLYQSLLRRVFYLSAISFIFFTFSKCIITDRLIIHLLVFCIFDDHVTKLDFFIYISLLPYIVSITLSFYSLHIWLVITLVKDIHICLRF